MSHPIGHATSHPFAPLLTTVSRGIPLRSSLSLVAPLLLFAPLLFHAHALLLGFPVLPQRVSRMIVFFCFFYLTFPQLLPILSLSRIAVGAHTQPNYTMQTLTNSFHGTSIRIRSAHAWDYIATRAYYAHRELPRYRSVHDERFIRLHRRIKSTLCGSLTCECGTVR